MAFRSRAVLAQIVNFLRGAPMKSYEKIFVGLFRRSGEFGAAVEVQGGGYRRQRITFDSVEGKIAVSNAGEIAFPRASDPWGTVVGYGLYDGEEGGERLLEGEVTAEAFVGTGMVYGFRKGDLVVEFPEG